MAINDDDIYTHYPHHPNARRSKLDYIWCSVDLLKYLLNSSLHNVQPIIKTDHCLVSCTFRINDLINITSTTKHRRKRIIKTKFLYNDMLLFNQNNTGHHEWLWSHFTEDLDQD
ncbi:hypothetical protein RCL_jg12663.t1 [Rhizophagus clarus]|nr:hypothetical protein RCL_jg12663.t1 [Rhizophagus clarus]